MAKISDSEHCQDIVRRLDHGAYLIALFSPRETRDAVFAVAAFSIEIAAIRDQVSNPAIAKIKLFWWKEQIEAVFAGNPPNHPICLQLAKTIHTVPLAKVWLTRLINTQISGLSVTQFSTTEEMEEYAENAFSTQVYLHLQILGVSDTRADHAASHLGKTMGIVHFLRNLPLHASKRMFYMPAELMAKHSISNEDVFRGRNRDKLGNVVYEIATRANDQAITSRTFKKEIGAPAIPALLALLPSEQYLKILQKQRFDVFAPALVKRSISLPITLWMHAARRIF